MNMKFNGKLEALPKELIDTIKSFLDDRSRRAMRLASTKWLNIIQYDSFVFDFTVCEDFTEEEQQHLERELVEIYQQLERYNYPFGIAIKRPNFTFTMDAGIALGRLTQLTSLRLDQSLLLDVPEEYLWPLTQLTNLQRINFNLPLNNLTKLRHLKIEDPLERDSSLLYIPNLPNLESLSVGGRTIGKFTALPKLTSLSIGYNELTEDALGALTLFTALKLLHVHFSWWHDSISENMAFMTALTNLENFAGEGVDGPLCISSNKLTALKLRGKISISELNVNMSNLCSLCLKGKNESTTWSDLRNLQNLTKLHLTDVTKVEGLFRAIEASTQLKNLKIDYNNGKFNSEDILQIQHLKALESLHLYLRDLKLHVEFSSLRNLPLKKIALDWQVRDDFFDTILNFTSLEELVLADGGKMSDDTVAQLSGLSKLTHLHLGWLGKQMTGVTLTRLTSLQELYVESRETLSIDEDYLREMLPNLYDLTFEFI